MRLIIAGGRDYRLTPDDYRALDVIHTAERVTEVVSGKARGVDADGEYWAKRHGLPVKPFWPDWNAHGKAAGAIRNRQMAEYAEAVALFPGGRGTDSMRTEARRRGLIIFDFRKADQQPFLL